MLGKLSKGRASLGVIPENLDYVRARDLLAIDGTDPLAARKGLLDATGAAGVPAAEHDVVLVRTARHADHLSLPLLELKLHKLTVNPITSRSITKLFLGLGGPRASS